MTNTQKAKALVAERKALEADRLESLSSLKMDAFSFSIKNDNGYVTNFWVTPRGSSSQPMTGLTLEKANVSASGDRETLYVQLFNDQRDCETTARIAYQAAGFGTLPIAPVAKLTKALQIFLA